jgi:hypothetical protein
LASPSNFSNDARRQAAHILSQPPFVTKPSHIPDPLRGVLHALGRAFAGTVGKFASWLSRHFSSALHHVFGRYTWLGVAVIALAVGVVIGVLLVRRRTRVMRAGPSPDVQVPAEEDLSTLEAAADAAEARGDLEEAVRLRFRVGLTRLESAGIIASRLVTTTGQVRRAVRNPTFDGLAETHEAIAYAGKAASPADAGTARERWPQVIAEVAPAARAHKP